MKSGRVIDAADPGGELPLWQVPVTYGAIGATQDVELLRHPPAGFRPSERRARIGHGKERFEYAWSSAMCWGVQTGSGFRVRQLDAPPEVAGQSYTPLSFDRSGAPIPPGADPSELVFGPDGTPYLRAGDTVWLVLPLIGSLGIRSPVRVVYLIDEPTRKGFAYGTLPGHPEDGEEAFIVEHRDDDSVWLTIRAFSRPSTRFWWALYPVLRLAQEIVTRRYLRALAGPID